MLMAEASSRMLPSPASTYRGTGPGRRAAGRAHGGELGVWRASAGERRHERRLASRGEGPHPPAPSPPPPQCSPTHDGGVEGCRARQCAFALTSRILSSISLSCFLLLADSMTSRPFSSSKSGLSLATTIPSSWSSSPAGVIIKLSSVTWASRGEQSGSAQRQFEHGNRPPRAHSSRRSAHGERRRHARQGQVQQQQQVVASVAVSAERQQGQQGQQGQQQQMRLWSWWAQHSSRSLLAPPTWVCFDDLGGNANANHLDGRSRTKQEQNKAGQQQEQSSSSRSRVIWQ